MKKIKIIITVLYVAFAVEILGAWDNTPKVKEAIAYTDSDWPQKVLEENQTAVQEQVHRELYAKMRVEELEKSNEGYVAENAAQEERRDRAFKEAQERKERKRAKRREEREILERIVEAESGDQDLKGRILVANVILNRVKSEKFPDSVKGVVFAHRQFSPVSNGSYYRVTVSERTKKAVEKALNGTDYSNGALYFMCRSASDPSNVTWFDRALTKVKEYGCHEFFK